MILSKSRQEPSRCRTEEKTSIIESIHLSFFLFIHHDRTFCLALFDCYIHFTVKCPSFQSPWTIIQVGCLRTCRGLHFPYSLTGMLCMAASPRPLGRRTDNKVAWSPLQWTRNTCKVQSGSCSKVCYRHRKCVSWQLWVNVVAWRYICMCVCVCVCVC